MNGLTVSMSLITLPSRQACTVLGGQLILQPSVLHGQRLGPCGWWWIVDIGCSLSSPPSQSKSTPLAGSDCSAAYPAPIVDLPSNICSGILVT